MSPWGHMALSLTKAFVVLTGPHFTPGYGVANIVNFFPRDTSAVLGIEPTTFAFPAKCLNHSTTTHTYIILVAAVLLTK